MKVYKICSADVSVHAIKQFPMESKTFNLKIMAACHTFTKMPWHVQTLHLAHIAVLTALLSNRQVSS